MCKSIYKICKYLMFSKQIALNIQNRVCPQSWLSSNNVIQQMISCFSILIIKGAVYLCVYPMFLMQEHKGRFRKLTLKRKENMEPVSDP